MTFVSRAIDPRVGLMVAVVAIVGYIVCFAGIYMFVGQFIVNQVFHQTGSSLGITAMGVGYGLVVLVPVVIGLQLSMRLAILSYLFEVTVIMIVSFAVILSGGAHGLSATPFTFSNAGIHGIASALALAVLAFVGFEAPAPLAEESRDPRRNVPLAILVGIVVSGVIFVIGAYASVEAFPNIAAFAKSTSPLTYAADKFASPLGSVVTVLFLTSISGSFIIANTEVSRVIFSGAREGLWRHELTKVHKRFKTPWIAAIALVTPSLVIALVSILFWSAPTASGFLTTWGTLGIIFMYAATNVALIVHWFRERAAGQRRNIWTWLVLPLAGAAVWVVPYWSSFQPGQAAPLNKLWLYFGALLLLGLGYTVALRIRRPDLVVRSPSGC